MIYTIIITTCAMIIGISLFVSSNKIFKKIDTSALGLWIMVLSFDTYICLGVYSLIKWLIK